MHDAVKFWGTKVERLSVREITDVLSVTGGVPKYLEDVNPSLSAEENIRRLCFRTDGRHLFTKVGFCRSSRQMRISMRSWIFPR